MITGKDSRILSRLLLVALLTACGPAEQEVGKVNRIGDRVVHGVRWDTLYSIGGELQDTTLLRTRLLTAHQGLLYAYDYYDDRLKAFDEQGRLRWTFGRLGGGPGEFRNPTHLAVAPNGDVWVTDAGATRITVVTSDGVLRRHIPFNGELIMRSLPGTEEAYAVLTSPGDLWIVLNEAGQVESRGGFPSPELASVDPVIRTAFASKAPTSDLWAVAFPLGNPLLVYQRRELRCTGRLIEGAPFPSVRTGEDPIWAVAVAMADTSVFVLGRGQTEYELQLLDEYSAEDCRYLRTLRLPRKLQAMAYDDGVFYFYHEEPAPRILALRLASG